jgi:FtsP/CotA-like multicopper oxidase with cupredoxin domain
MIGASRRLIFLVLGLVGMLSSERMVMATSFSPGLMDPSTQPKFEEPVAEAMADSFKVQLVENEVYKIASYRTSQETGLVDPSSGTGERLVTPVFGYGFSEDGASWPSPTLEIRKGDLIKIRWKNKLYIEGNQTGLPFTSMTGKSVVDTSVHWAYTTILEFEGYTVEDQGVPTVVHVHGSRAQQRFDGNARAFFNNDYEIRGSQWRDSLYVYANNQEATALWYHDHALGKRTERENVLELRSHTQNLNFFSLSHSLCTHVPCVKILK